MEKQFSISLGDNLSIKDLLDFFKKGFMVMRSGHLGNHYFSNLLLFNLGIVCHLFDRNLLWRDTNFYPGYIIYQGKKQKISEDGEVLVPLSKFKTDQGEYGQFVKGSFSPGNFHQESIKKTFPNLLVWSESEFMVKNINLVEEIVYHLVEFDSSLFSRRVNEKGETFQGEVVSKKIVKEVLDLNQSIFSRLSNKDFSPVTGIIPNIEAAIVITTLVSALTTGKDKVFEISGPDMVTYTSVKNFSKSVNEAYCFLKNKIPQLPKKIELVVVPSFSFRLGSLTSERAQMNDLWETLKKFNSLKAEKSLKIKEIMVQGLEMKEALSFKSEIIKATGAKEKMLLEKVVTFGDIIGRMNFSQINGNGKICFRDNFFSQHDLFCSGEELYMPEEIMSLTMKEIDLYYSIIESAQKQYS